MRQVVVILIIVTFAAVANAFEIGWDSYPWHVKYSGWRDNTGKVSNKCVVTLGNFSDGIHRQWTEICNRVAVQDI